MTRTTIIEITLYWISCFTIIVFRYLLLEEWILNIKYLVSRYHAISVKYLRISTGYGCGTSDGLVSSVWIGTNFKWQDFISHRNSGICEKEGHSLKIIRSVILSVEWIHLINPIRNKFFFFQKPLPKYFPASSPTRRNVNFSHLLKIFFFNIWVILILLFINKWLVNTTLIPKKQFFSLKL